MPQKFRNKYRISSARLQNWDYGKNASYFITICTFKRFHYFGSILNGKMQLNKIGELAEKYWMEIPQHFLFVELQNFVIMPDHMHGILTIKKPEETRHCLVSSITYVDNPDNSHDDPNKTPGQLRFRNQGKNTISSIVGSYKSVVTKNARFIEKNFRWQSRFHDHVIRDSSSFERIQKYIVDNPKNWKCKAISLKR